MSCSKHDNHEHKHGEGCGHTAIKHHDHVDYVHDNHLHHMHGDHVDECALDMCCGNNDKCTADHACGAHDAGHQHGAGCGHEAVPHGDHTDYLVNGHLHRPCSGHCDDHGAVACS